MQSYIAYLRVSTARQGSTGVSLDEQRLAIKHYAHLHNITITRWYTEVHSASCRRPVFEQLIQSLAASKTRGLLVHKIDRGARRLGDWARLGELIDQGVDVRFVHDDLDLRSRGGRLAADIQAVIAADYVRNLREETIKGIRGRLRQGLRPFPAPFGYLDRGRGNPKALDPERAPLVQEAFRLYASGSWTLETLALEMYGRGARTKSGKAVTRSGWSRILNNDFYAGLLLIPGTRDLVPGLHEPLVSETLFDQVQSVLRGRRSGCYAVRHCFRYSRQLLCSGCRHSLVGEKQKRHVYYRCHHCRGGCVRESSVELLLKSGEIVLRHPEITNSRALDQSSSPMRGMQNAA